MLFTCMTKNGLKVRSSQCVWIGLNYSQLHFQPTLDELDGTSYCKATGEPMVSKFPPNRFVRDGAQFFNILNRSPNFLL